MTETELKSSIVKIVATINDSSILENLHNLLLQHKAEKEEVEDTMSWVDIPEYEKQAILTGLEQLKRGEGIPHEQVMAKAKKILGQV